MTINVYESNGLALRGPVIHQADKLSDALSWLEANRNIAYSDCDNDHNDCADAIGYDGSVVSIQPHDFQL